MRENRTEEAEIRQFVTFVLGDEVFGVQIMKVQEIIRWQEVTRVPNLPAFIEGILDLRGEVIPIIDLRKRFGFEPRPPDAATRIVVINIATFMVGLVVDGVRQVLKPTADQLAPPPRLIAGIASRYLEGICRFDNRLVIILDIERILSEEEFAQLAILE
jgi:purine-binding chemotaxis protein CheW